VIGIEDGFDGFLHPEKCRVLGLPDVRGILPRGGTILGTTNRGNPFSYMIQREGKVKLADVSGEVLSTIERLGISGLVVVGGDGSLKIALKLMKRGVPIVGVPKTIGSDLLETDVTFGYKTALETATDALDKLHSTAAPQNDGAGGDGALRRLDRPGVGDRGGGGRDSDPGDPLRHRAGLRRDS
jgi:6-phosphofructokinase 1